jgi:Adenylate and Guanylate cyclase catalytic domain
MLLMELSGLLPIDRCATTQRPMPPVAWVGTVEPHLGYCPIPSETGFSGRESSHRLPRFRESYRLSRLGTPVLRRYKPPCGVVAGSHGLLRDYHEAIGLIITKYNGTLERYAGDGVMVVFNDPVPVDNPALQAVLMALEVRDALGALTATWSRLGHEIGFGIGIAHGFATLGTIGFEGRFDYAAIGTVSNVASRLCDEAKPGQILISRRVLVAVENAVQVEPVGEFELKGIRRPVAAYNILGALSREPE